MARAFGGLASVLLSVGMTACGSTPPAEDASASDDAATADSMVTDAAPVDASPSGDAAAADASAPDSSFVNLCGNHPGATIEQPALGQTVPHAIILGDSGDGKARYALVFTAPASVSTKRGTFDSSSPSVVNWSGSVNLSTVACDFDGTSSLSGSTTNAIRIIDYSVGSALPGAVVLEPGRSYAFNVVLDSPPPVVLCNSVNCNWFIDFDWPE